MAASIQVKRGATAKVAAYTPLSGELVLDTTTNKLYAGDGSTAGGNQIVASKKGVTDGSDAATGEVGEYLSATQTSNTMTNGIVSNIASLTLTAGDWDVEGVISSYNSSAALSYFVSGLNTTSGANPAFPYVVQLTLAFSSAGVQRAATPTRRVSVSASTVIYLIAQVGFTSGSTSCDGFIRARRIR